MNKPIFGELSAEMPDGYVMSMENSIPAMNDPSWMKYLHGVQRFNESILGWLDRNAK